jgi:ribonuclease P protein component
LTVSVAPNDLSHNRYGFITGKRIGKAVARNRARRLLREAVRQLHPQLQPGFDVVLIARLPVVGQRLSTIQRIVDDLLGQAGLMSEREVTSE